MLSVTVLLQLHVFYLFGVFNLFGTPFVFMMTMKTDRKAAYRYYHGNKLK